MKYRILFSALIATFISNVALADEAHEAVMDAEIQKEKITKKINAANIAANKAAIASIQLKAGPAGAKGATGAQGIQGKTGLTGAAGAKGATGAQGLRGLPGSAGADGVTGVQGIQGPAGNNGTDGASCSVADNGDGTATLNCPDGTSIVFNAVIAVPPAAVKVVEANRCFTGDFRYTYTYGSPPDACTTASRVWPAAQTIPDKSSLDAQCAIDVGVPEARLAVDNRHYIISNGILPTNPLFTPTPQAASVAITVWDTLNNVFLLSHLNADGTHAGVSFSRNAAWMNANPIAYMCTYPLQ